MRDDRSRARVLPPLRSGPWATPIAALVLLVALPLLIGVLASSMSAQGPRDLSGAPQLSSSAPRTFAPAAGASLTVDPSSGVAGSSASFNGEGFDVDVTVTVSWSGGSACSGVSTGAGVFECAWTVSPAPIGSYTFTATDGTNSASTAFLIEPEMTATPTSGAGGTSITFSGNGFNANSPLDVLWATGTPCATTTGTNGGFTCPAWVVPYSTAPGTYTFTAEDNTDHEATASFTVTSSAAPLQIAEFTVSPRSQTANSSVTFTVAASGGVGTLSYTYSGLPQGCATSDTSTLTCSPSEAGNFSVTVVVTDQGGHSAQSSIFLTVTWPAVPNSNAGFSWVYLVVILVIAAVVGMIVLMLNMRKRKAERMGPEHPSMGPAPYDPYGPPAGGPAYGSSSGPMEADPYAPNAFTPQHPSWPGNAPPVGPGAPPHYVTATMVPSRPSTPSGPVESPQIQGFRPQDVNPQAQAVPKGAYQAWSADTGGAKTTVTPIGGAAQQSQSDEAEKERVRKLLEAWEQKKRQQQQQGQQQQGPPP
jgi:hypothetical protein